MLVQEQIQEIQQFLVILETLVMLQSLLVWYSQEVLLVMVEPQIQEIQEQMD